MKETLLQWCLFSQVLALLFQTYSQFIYVTVKLQLCYVNPVFLLQFLRRKMPYKSFFSLIYFVFLPGFWTHSLFPIFEIIQGAFYYRPLSFTFVLLLDVLRDDFDRVLIPSRNWETSLLFRASLGFSE